MLVNADKCARGSGVPPAVRDRERDAPRDGVDQGQTAPVVRLHMQDGRRVDCAIERDSALDRPGVTYWTAVPAQPVALGTYEVELVSWRPHTGFTVRVPLADLGSMMPRSPR